MRAGFRYILTCIVLMTTVFSSCKMEEDKVIPRKKMARIYAEMLITDQWIQADSDLRKLADTTLIYEPILEKYGYDSEIYRRSVFEYLDDPERFSRILRRTVNIIDKRIDELNRQLDEDKKLKDRLAKSERFKVDYKMEDHFPYVFREPYVHYYDSLFVEMDTLTNSYMIKEIELSDTLYDGIEVIIKLDSTAVLDSIARVDSLARADSLARVDSLARADSIRKLVHDKERVLQKQITRRDIRSAAGMELINEQKKKRIDE